MTLIAPYHRGQCVSTEVEGLLGFELKDGGIVFA